MKLLDESLRNCNRVEEQSESYFKDLNGIFTGESQDLLNNRLDRFKNEFGGLKKQLECDIIQLRDDAFVELEDRVSIRKFSTG